MVVLLSGEPDAQIKLWSLFPYRASVHARCELRVLGYITTPSGMVDP